MFFHFRLYAFRWDHGIKYCFSVFILVWRKRKIDPSVKDVSFLIFRLAWNFHQSKPEVMKRLHVKSLNRKFSFV